MLIDRGPDVAIVIPAWNERANLERLLPDIDRVVRQLELAAEVVVVDGGSRDGTPEAVRRLGHRCVVQREPGYAAALLAGFAATTAPYIVTLEADGSHPPEVIIELWRQREEADVLVASRYVPGGDAGASRARRLLSRLLNRIYARVLALPVRDLSSSYRMYRRATLAPLQLRARHFDALQEILIRVYGEGWSIREVPLQVRPRAGGASHARVLPLGLAFLVTLVRMYRLRNSVMAADYDYRAFHSPIWFQRHWQRTRHRIVMDLLDEREAVLDVGCGSGQIILDLPDAVGLDILHRKLRWLRPRHRRLVCGSAAALPFRDASFSAVVSSEVIEHIPDTPEVLGEMTRVLRPGGLLVLGTPDYGSRVWCAIEWVYSKVLPDAYADEHITHFTRESLAARLRAAGYEILEHRYLLASVVIFKARKPGANRPPPDPTRAQRGDAELLAGAGASAHVG